MKKICLKLIVIFVFMLFCFNRVFAMQIYVQDQKGNNITIEAESSDTIEAFKNKIINKINELNQIEGIYIDIEQIKLNYDGNVLEDFRTLADYNVERESTIHSVIIYSIKYKIDIKSSVGGEILVNFTEAKEKEEISLKIEPKKDYKFKSIKIYKTDEPSIIIEVKDNTFTMPAYDVTLEAQFEKLFKPVLDETPMTGNSEIEYVIWLTIAITSVIGMVITKRLIKEK